MKQDYYSQKIFIPQVDRQDSIIGPIERWKAHKEGILHRGLTVGLLFNHQFLCQHRKHPVFNGFMDLTSSTHPRYIDNKVQSIEEAAYDALLREWKIVKKDVINLHILGKIQYRSMFQRYIEHEVCYFLIGEIDYLPPLQNEFAYGYSLFSKKELTSKSNAMNQILAPWVKQAFAEKLI